MQILGIIQGAKDGKGRGRQVIAVAKTCNLIFIVLDVLKPLTDKRIIETELEGFGIRVNKSPPNIIFRKKERGGINITSTMPLTNLDNDVCQSQIQFPLSELTQSARKSELCSPNTEYLRQILHLDVMPLYADCEVVMQRLGLLTDQKNRLMISQM